MSFWEKSDKDLYISSIQSLHAGSKDADEEMTNFADNDNYLGIRKQKPAATIYRR